MSTTPTSSRSTARPLRHKRESKLLRGGMYRPSGAKPVRTERRSGLRLTTQDVPASGRATPLARSYRAACDTCDRAPGDSRSPTPLIRTLPSEFYGHTRPLYKSKPYATRKLQNQGRTRPIRADTCRRAPFAAKRILESRSAPNTRAFGICILCAAQTCGHTDPRGIR